MKTEVILLRINDFEDTLKQQLEPVFRKEQKIAIKLHMGEPGNKYAMKPPFVKKIVQVLKGLGTKPFLFDSPVLYSGPRHTEEGYLKGAASMGFTEQNIGCQIIVSNESIKVKGQKLTYEVCKYLTEADGVLILSHVKGHICCGFGGAIKNIGMGAVTRETKGLIHSGGEPNYVGECTLCGQCAKVCPNDHIRYSDKPHFDKSWCCGCSNCADICPQHAIITNMGSFDFLLSEAASSALKNFKKFYCVNVIKNITKHCDCMADSGPIVLEDIGILLSKDIVAIEKASLDLINKKAGKDLFEEIHHKSPLVHIKAAEKLGMGKLDYSLTTV